MFTPTQPTYPTVTHTLAYTINRKTPPLPGLAQWACYKASAYGSRVGWTPAQRIDSGRGQTERHKDAQ